MAGRSAEMFWQPHRGDRDTARAGMIVRSRRGRRIVDARDDAEGDAAARAMRAPVDRRTFGAGILALLAAPTLASAAARHGAAPRDAARRDVAGLRGPLLDLTTADGNVTAMAKLAADLDLTKTKHGWYEGLLIGTAPGGATRELVGVVGLSSQRLTKLADRPGWLVLQKEVGFFTDLETGRVLDRWRNPYTNEDVEPFHIANPAVNRPIEPVVRDTRFYDTVAGSEPKERPFVLAWRAAGGRAFVETRSHVWAKNPLDPAVWTRESAGPNVQVMDAMSYSVALDELQDPKRTTCAYVGHWVHLRPWQPWMLMGSAPGGCLYSATTGCASSLDGLPEHIVGIVRERAPEFLVAPTEIRKSEPSLVRYQRERKPAPPRTGEAK
jgi:hypothetical protein